MTKRQRCLFVLAMAVVAVGLTLAADAEAQVVTYYSDPVWYPSFPHYHRVYQGTSWHWTPWLGWHRHDHYADVPCWRSSYYVCDQNGVVHRVGYVYR